MKIYLNEEQLNNFFEFDDYKDFGVDNNPQSREDYIKKLTARQEKYHQEVIELFKKAKDINNREDGVDFNRVYKQEEIELGQQIAHVFLDDLISKFVDTLFVGIPKTEKEAQEMYEQLLKKGGSLDRMYRKFEEKLEKYQIKCGNVLDRTHKMKDLIRYNGASCARSLLSTKYMQIERLWEASGSYYRSIIKILNYLEK